MKCKYTDKGRNHEKCNRDVWSKDKDFCIFHSGKHQLKGDEFRNALDEILNTPKSELPEFDFNGYVFPLLKWKNFDRPVVFRDSKFPCGADFNSVEFHGVRFYHVRFVGQANFNYIVSHGVFRFGHTNFRGAQFYGAKFQGGISMDNSSFMDITNFENCTFWGADISHTYFHDIVVFLNSTFKKNCSISYCTFCKYTEFSGSVFEHNAKFIINKFYERAWFRNIKAKGFIDFSGTSFQDYTLFMDAEFGKNVNFSDAEFCGKLSFDGAIINKCLCFDNARFGIEPEFKCDLNLKKCSKPIEEPPIDYSFGYEKFMANHWKNQHYQLDEKTAVSFCLFSQENYDAIKDVPCCKAK